MRALVFPAILVLVMAVIGHVLTLHLVPSVIMGTAMNRLAAQGAALHSFRLAPRTTPQTQLVVRPSPDLAYSICAYHLRGPQPLRIRAAAYDDYGSISFFDARTNNFATIRIEETAPDSSGPDILLRGPAGGEPDGLFDGHDLKSPTPQGLILIRRLAPTQQAYDRVKAIASADVCALSSSAGTISE
jgi:uncharacterized membrane protein